MTLKLLTNPVGDPVVIDASRVLAVEQVTSTAIDKSTSINCWVYFGDYTETSGVLIKGDLKTVIRQLGLLYTITL